MSILESDPQYGEWGETPAFGSINPAVYGENPDFSDLPIDQDARDMLDKINENWGPIVMGNVVRNIVSLDDEKSRDALIKELQLTMEEVK